jgi:hypothetical protein
MRPLTPPSVRAHLPRAQPSKPMNNFYAPWCAKSAKRLLSSASSATTSALEYTLGLSTGIHCCCLWVLLVVGIFLAVACHNGESELSRVDCATNADVRRPYSQMRLGVGGV